MVEKIIFLDFRIWNYSHFIKSVNFLKSASFELKDVAK